MGPHGPLRVPGLDADSGTPTPRTHLRTYTIHYNRGRPHRGLGLDTPEGLPVLNAPICAARLRRHDVLGGLTHEYEAVA